MDSILTLLGISILAGVAFPQLIRLRPALFVALAVYLLDLLLALALWPLTLTEALPRVASFFVALNFLLQVFIFYELVVAYGGLTTPGIFREIGLGFGWLTASDKRGFPVNPPPKSGEDPTMPPSPPSL